MLLTTLLISLTSMEPMVPTIGHAVTHSSILWISFLPLPCLISLLTTSASWHHPEINHFTQILWQGCSWRPAEGTLRVFIPDLTSSAQRSQKRARACSVLRPLLHLLCATTALHATPSHFCLFLTGSWWVVQCYFFKGTLVYRVFVLSVVSDIWGSWHISHR